MKFFAVIRFVMPSALLPVIMAAPLLLVPSLTQAKTGQCNCFATDAAAIKYWGTHLPATSCTGFARSDALTKAKVECQRYSGAKESCSIAKTSCSFQPN